MLLEEFQKVSEDFRRFQRCFWRLQRVSGALRSEGVSGGFQRHFREFQNIFKGFRRRYRSVFGDSGTLDWDPRLLQEIFSGISESFKGVSVSFRCVIEAFFCGF